MHYHLFSSNRSFRLMLYLEWILLGINILGEIQPIPFRISPISLFWVILILIGFGLMGLKLPRQNIRNKILYTGLEFGLLFLVFLVDGRTILFPILGLIIVIRSCLIFQQTGRLIVTGLVFAVFLLMLMRQVLPPLPQHDFASESFSLTILTLKLNMAVSFGLTILFILLLVNAILSERRSRDKLFLANVQLRQYALRIEDQATLQERNRIAREIHDALGHTLTAQSIQLENALLFLPSSSEKTEAFLKEAKQLGFRALQEVRRSITTLRSDPLLGRSLEAAINQTIEEFCQTTGLIPKCTLQLSQTVATEISIALFRIMQ